MPKGELHKDKTFPWVNFVHDHFTLDGDSSPYEGKGPKMVDVHQSLGGVFNVLEGWRLLKKGWSLTSNGKSELAQKYLDEYKNTSVYNEDANLDSILFHFSSLLTRPAKWKLFERTAAKMQYIQKANPIAFENFRKYFRENLYLEHRGKYLEVYSSYFKSFNEYNQVLLYSKNQRPIDESFHVSSVDFKNTKMFYGDAFEILTVSFTTLACLNNLLNGRNYDQFESMSLAKYQTINKANRANPFSSTEPFNEFSSCINSQIRNASHHQSMKINKDGIVSYRSPDGGSWKTLPYIKYLYYCNEIMLTLCCLHLIELLLAYENK